MPAKDTSIPHQTQMGFIDSLLSQLEVKGTNQVSVAAVIGSSINNDQNFDSFSDLDLLVILRNPPVDDPSNSKRYFLLIETIKGIQETYARKGIHFCIFPTHRTEEFTRFLAYDEYKRHYALVHLLVYPSLEFFVKWEPPSIVDSICATGNAILGDETLLEEARRHVKKVPFRERIDSLLSLLYETHRFLECSQLREEIRVMETIHMLGYILQYLCGEILREKGYAVGEAYNWGFISKKAGELGPECKSLIASLRSSEVRERRTSLEQIRTICVELFRFFNQILATT